MCSPWRSSQSRTLQLDRQFSPWRSSQSVQNSIVRQVGLVPGDLASLEKQLDRQVQFLEIQLVQNYSQTGRFRPWRYRQSRTTVRQVGLVPGDLARLDLQLDRYRCSPWRSSQSRTLQLDRYRCSSWRSSQSRTLVRQVGLVPGDLASLELQLDRQVQSLEIQLVQTSSQTGIGVVPGDLASLELFSQTARFSLRHVRSTMVRLKIRLSENEKDIHVYLLKYFINFNFGFF